MGSNISIQNQLSEYLYSRGLISNTTLWCQQSGGQTNKVWKLTGEMNLICKLYLDTNNNPLFNNEPIFEYKCLLWLENSSIAPKVYKYLETPVGQVLLYYYIDGPIWSQDVNDVSELLNRVRSHKPLKELRHLSGSPSDIKKSGLHILGKLKKTYKDDLLKLCPEVSVSEIEPVLLHTDVVAGNIISGKSGLRLIDWQCPAIGDPVVDIMMFLSPGMHEIYGSGKLSMMDHEKFISCQTTQLQDRYNLVGPLYHWRLAAYCFWKAEQGFSEYENAALAEIDLLKMI